MLLSERAISAWIDTNAMLEAYSIADLLEARSKGNLEDVESRRIRSQGTLWLATILSLQQAVTISYSHEGLRNLMRMAPPGSRLHAWSQAIVFVLGPGGGFDGWIDGATSTGATLTNRQRDKHMIDLCKQMGVVLFTRDRQANEEARAVGVRAMTPEEYAIG